MKNIFGVALGILAAIGGFVDIGDIVFNVAAGATFGYQLLWAVVLGVGGIITYAEMRASLRQETAGRCPRARFVAGRAPGNGLAVARGREAPYDSSFSLHFSRRPRLRPHTG